MGARRVLVRERDGSLTDAVELRPVTDSEVLDDLRAGLPFRAHRRGTGANCTIEVLARVMAASLGSEGRRDAPDGHPPVGEFVAELIGSHHSASDQR